ncbi:MAG: rhodanese-like domain-containing protein [Armatimonadota bacterium]
MALTAAVALLLALGVNALRPLGLSPWPAPGECAAVPPAVWQQIHFVDAADIDSLDAALLVDVREPEAYAVAHPPGAVNLPYREFQAVFRDFKAKVRPATPLCLYCYGSECGTSVRVANRLLQSSFTDVTIVRGGFEAWHAHGPPSQGEAAHD